MVNQAKILFVCDKRKCGSCRKDCDYTADIKHAKNFELSGGVYIERKKKVFKITAVSVALTIPLSFFILYLTYKKVSFLFDV